jgi:hypothetical protein
MFEAGHTSNRIALKFAMPRVNVRNLDWVAKATMDKGVAGNSDRVVVHLVFVLVGNPRMSAEDEFQW